MRTAQSASETANGAKKSRAGDNFLRSNSIRAHAQSSVAARRVTRKCTCGISAEGQNAQLCRRDACEFSPGVFCCCAIDNSEDAAVNTRDKPRPVARAARVSLDWRSGARACSQSRPYRHAFVVACVARPRAGAQLTGCAAGHHRTYDVQPNDTRRGISRRQPPQCVHKYAIDYIPTSRYLSAPLGAPNMPKPSTARAKLLAEALDGTEISAERIDHLRRYAELLFKPQQAGGRA